jgi:hypothetical protein
MGIVRKLRDGARWIESISDFEAPRPAPEPESTPPATPPPPEDARGVRLVRGLGQRIGFAGIVAVTLGAALLGAAGCKVPGQPQPRAPYTEDAPAPDYQCHYDGNRRCPPPPAPPVQASCDEPAVWCHRGHATEAVQR